MEPAGHQNRARLVFSTAFDWATSLIFPQFCLGCGKYGGQLCCNCFQQIEICRTSTCFSCGRISGNGRLCPNCRKKHGFSISEIIWACSYKDEIVKELIHSFKYGGSIEAGEIASGMLLERMLRWKVPAASVVVPVPIHHRKQNSRGFNQAEIIARIISQRLGLTGGLALTRTRATETQVHLSRSGRENNLSGAISISDQELVAGKNIILIDDVATTGSTLNECAKVLKRSGARKVVAAVVARG